MIAPASPPLTRPSLSAAAVTLFFQDATPAEIERLAEDPVLWAVAMRGSAAMQTDGPLSGEPLEEPLEWETLSEAASDKAAQRAAFEKQLRKRLAQAEQEKLSLLRETRKTLKQYRDQVVATFTPVTEWDSYRLGQVKSALEELDTVYQRRITGGFKDSATRMSALAFGAATDPLQALGLQVDHIPAVFNDKLQAFMNDYYPALIQDVTSTVRTEVGKLLTQQTLGGLGSADVLKRIGDLVGPLQRPGAPGTPGLIQTAESRARRIMVTEMNRVYNVTLTSQIDSLAERNPGVCKRWIHRPEASNEPRPGHAAMNGKVIYPAKGEVFELPSGAKCNGPHDPSLPADESIGCHCTVVVGYDAVAGQAAAGGDAITPGDGTNIPSAGVTAAPRIPAPPKIMTPRPPAPPPPAARISKPVPGTREYAETVSRIHDEAIQGKDFLKKFLLGQGANEDLAEVKAAVYRWEYAAKEFKRAGMTEQLEAAKRAVKLNKDILRGVEREISDAAAAARKASGEIERIRARAVVEFDPPPAAGTAEDLEDYAARLLKHHGAKAPSVEFASLNVPAAREMCSAMRVELARAERAMGEGWPLKMLNLDGRKQSWVAYYRASELQIAWHPKWVEQYKDEAIKWATASPDARRRLLLTSLDKARETAEAGLNFPGAALPKAQAAALRKALDQIEVMRKKVARWNGLGPPPDAIGRGIRGQYRRGMPVKYRPQNARDYCLAKDEMQQTACHEIGHHVQHSKVTTTDLREAFKAAKAEGVAVSNYALEDEYEWFAENWSCWWMGPRENCCPKFIELCRRCAIVLEA